MSRISIAIPHYNQPHLISRAIESLSLTCLKDIQLLVMDDASSDDVFAQLQQQLDKTKQLSKHPIRLFRASKNVGTYRMKNAIIQQLDTEYLAFHDADDFSVAMRLDRLYDGMRDSNIDILGSAYMEVMSDLDKGDSYYIKRFYKMPYLAHKVGIKYISYQPSQLVRFSCFDTLGGFDGSTRIGADDEFTLRAVHCKKVRNLSEPLYVKIEQAKSLTTDETTGYQSPIRAAYKQKMADLRKKIKTGLSQEFYRNTPNDEDFSLKEF
ncbi:MULTISPECIES: glycosyltransferase family 2 protein [Pseudoalteromonas]|uniref:glycosyltransferase family 2 protein n=1 Tax=Pseudoalteromonas TaxID=53246 RepID=UPI000C7B0931|nr:MULTISPECIES: glycosyltransferase family A protein [unclassified Pseudoalteromonas]AUJ70680.1 putative glycosyltransferase EpsJ [Pseudoalteromonas sp. NC201]MCF2825433.1 glycosyltransferase family 2 protein [Pseudoalteromonas sp. OF5H-5]MCF2833534.1 glycosyltransferase family 2 protein [Pseudoalteromonas sp. DL2-H6]MCF2923188.1 glycosyltransferase family 2 protein [Pseudoalteromonas sp. DL2-H1]MCF7512540.1 glycosyltransferase family 2 protein [Pseudoalteromonas sp. L7]